MADGFFPALWGRISAYFLHVREFYGYDFTVFYDDYFASKYWEAIGVTVQIALLVLVCSFAIGFLGAAWRVQAGKAGARFLDGYVALFRNTPVLAQLYFLYFGLGGILLADPTLLFGVGPHLSGFFWLVLALSLHFGAYNIEAVRAGLLAVPASTLEAALALGYTPQRALWRIQMPIALRIVLPSLSNNLVQIVKTTAIGYAVAVPEILYIANRIWTERLNVTETMNVVLLSYLVLVGLAVFLMGCLERALRIPGMKG